MPSNELRSEFRKTNTLNTVRTYIQQINTIHTGLDIRASLGLSSNWGVGDFRRHSRVQGGRPDDGRRRLAGRSGPWSCRRGGRGPNQCVGQKAAVPAVLTMVNLNKSGDRLKECEGLHFRIKRDSVPRSLR
jgi:hypothetical protein